MSTIEEITKSKTTVFIKPKEGFLLSTSRDLFSVVMLCLMVYVSKDSSWWTLVTGLIFVCFIYGRLKKLLEKNSTTFETKEAAIEWLSRKEI